MYIFSYNTTKAIEGQEHQYIHNLHHSNDREYLAAFNANYEKYFGELKATAFTGTPAFPEESSADEEL